MKICIASNNRNKIRQFGEIFAREGIAADFYTAKEVGFSEFPPEDADSFRGNSFIKANAVRKYLESKGEAEEYYVIADDSGICVDALNGAPGVYSARFSGEHATDDENNQKLIGLLQGVENRKAHYQCAVVAITPDGDVLHGDGRVDGRIVDEPKGHDGFGYDPYFYVDEYEATFAQLPAEIRNGMSHRGNAIRALISKIKI